MFSPQNRLIDSLGRHLITESIRTAVFISLLLQIIASEAGVQASSRGPTSPNVYIYRREQQASLHCFKILFIGTHIYPFLTQFQGLESMQYQYDKRNRALI